MSKNVYVPTNKTPELHLGCQTNYEKLRGSYFEEEHYDEEGFMYKSIIVSIKYKPDIIYRSTDGYGGRCWEAEIIDSKEDDINIYHFRNFVDLVKLYEENGYKFIENQKETK